MIKRYHKSGHSGENNQKTKLQENVHTHSHLSKSKVEAGTESSDSNFPSGTQNWLLLGESTAQEGPCPNAPRWRFCQRCPPVECVALSCPDRVLRPFLRQDPVWAEGDLVGRPGSDKAEIFAGTWALEHGERLAIGLPRAGRKPGDEVGRTDENKGILKLTEQGPQGGSVS